MSCSRANNTCFELQSLLPAAAHQGHTPAGGTGGGVCRSPDGRSRQTLPCEKALLCAATQQAAPTRPVYR